MITVAEALRIHAPNYLAEHRNTLPTAHRRVIASILDCRTEALGTLRFHCTECGMAFDLNRSCGNRHCPTFRESEGGGVVTAAPRSTASGTAFHDHLHRTCCLQVALSPPPSAVLRDVVSELPPPC